MKIGVDFDNTIVSYDKVFHKVALERSLIKKNLNISKIAVRDHLRDKGQNDIWTELQGYVYGKRLLEADVFPGFIDFLNFASNNCVEVLIVSHKTIYPYLGNKYNLHDSAREFISKFLTNQNKNLVNKKNIFFELTQEKKALRIGQQLCNYFIDDLPEIFALHDFPKKTNKILFDPDESHNNFDDGEICSSWENIQELVSNDLFRR
jgi:hypothetical protein